MSRRLRRFTACAVCKRDHKKCDGGRPCARCVNLSSCQECVDVAPNKRTGVNKRKFIHHESMAPSALSQIPVQTRDSNHVSRMSLPFPQNVQRDDVVKPTTNKIQRAPAQLLETILGEIKNLAQTAHQLQEEQEVLRSELRDWTDRGAQSHTPSRSHPNQRVAQPRLKRQKKEAPPTQAIIKPPLLSFPESPFVIIDPMKPFCVLRPDFTSAQFSLRPIAANDAMSKLLDISMDDVDGEYDCNSIVPSYIPINSIAREQMFIEFVTRSKGAPHSPVKISSVTYCTKHGKYIDAETRKQVFYNEKGEPSFVIVVVDRVFVPSHYLYHLQTTASPSASGTFENRLLEASSPNTSSPLSEGWDSDTPMDDTAVSDDQPMDGKAFLTTSKSGGDAFDEFFSLLVSPSSPFFGRFEEKHS